MHPKDLRIENYTYSLPDEQVAKYPLSERDASRLLLFDNGEITEDQYRNIAAHLPEGTLMIFNQTKVVNARLQFKKSTGSSIEVFCLAPHSTYADIQTAMLQKGHVLWECLVGGASKWKPGMVLQLTNDVPGFTLSASIKERLPSAFILELSWDNAELTFAEVLHHVGKVPLPPYLHREADKKDEATYQTTYAREEGSVAAPTAGLHFTPAIFESLAQKHINPAFVTLHVGAGTFRPVKSDTMAEHDMHAEWIEVERNMLQLLLNHGNNKVVAVGTTSMRTLESIYWVGCKLLAGSQIDWQGIAVDQWDPYEIEPAGSIEAALGAVLQWMDAHAVTRLITRTRILIAPGYTFRLTDGLVTNFHQPQSTLLLLVSALIGEDWQKVYGYALEKGFRFLSYGDGSLLWRKHK